ncbi:MULTISPECIES: NAD(P)H-dependent oxidoreductase [unclassified Halomonas]|uniref:FMN-dependent NADH-azoreductase n=1 Tax=unclassified Halomonas TaxID=2609666 RepID=UPI0007D95527|nr:MULTISPECIES: NAD(P)H-dependent oxidoreductase [unclassified Halomonas]MBT2785311.1 NAD(P)H-dependent oxidoreductase [Halomonas sp. ISL-106]MBT2799332.1 NAD(P)H-dependent oxidoreductase [Halomonas sp. ISL-104]OAL59590.1 FMN-dependent NADH-azoreductase [Halomonas sp. ALS9]
MRTLLHIDASVRMATNPNPDHNSISKRIAMQFVSTWQSLRNIDKYIYRDIGLTPPAFIDQEWIGAVFTPDERKSPEQCEKLALSDQLFSELAQADVILISSPMYNYGMPAPLKAWFDQVMRINKTFSFDLARGDHPIEPLLSGKTLVLVTSCGEFGFGPGEEREHMNHLGPHIKTLGRYLGVESFHEISAEYQEFGDERHQQSVASALKNAGLLAADLAIKE